MKHFKKYIIVLFSLSSLLANAQRNSGFIGKKNFIGFEKSVKLTGWDYRKPGIVGKTYFDRIKFERTINKRTHLGFSIGWEKNYVDFYRLNFFQNKFNSDNGTYPVEFNGKQLKSDYGSGRIKFSSKSLEFTFKKFFRYSTFSNLGNFWELNCGIIKNNISLSPGFIFGAYDSIDNNYNRLNYHHYEVLNENNYNSTQGYIGFKLGHNYHFILDRLILSASAGINLNLGFFNRDTYAKKTVADMMSYSSFVYNLNSNLIKLNFGLHYAL